MASEEDERAGAEIVHGKEACDRFSEELMKEIGFPSGVFPIGIGELEECGRVKATGFVWWKCKAPYEHIHIETNSKGSYEAETTAYVEKGRMKKMTGVTARKSMLKVSVVEMSIEGGNKVTFKTAMGVSKTFPITLFMNEEEKKIFLQTQQNGAAN
ncbi:uncharacterized protein LOC122082109 [Macadamia integrifolia]|uniref:uncharacterized protein LOC122082109 n=1 Tax=Macadamia integrifolia TaxID=60698 RepID=UPI001C4EE893|nr:uncharacterized protein LOC122082109 [Macadamia integrifolia]